ncbi:TPA: 50S ribosomal protein L25 [Yersinia enterocolitica]|uniref:Large ribosomal subunit protein bL25 n=4 Tax=Yersinia enterocolitica TaxID=630 RepID=RL25_YERE8|nr:50S ribosomal protein L25 [Yersinia enterocolitica]A1JLN0.1 RecName: Full=Large ribosomal subunit protein bL25; AltName: Full=50S ribosomal protein L25 [Yersinia enterocolitica subsp. enterocolitica 8081]CBX70569.1 50S ribosomal protein L25 [Yersinia enterocolitica W22703]ADZ43188.1 50S ribosomal protein L25 [Yersinia enterocolitica subsp. palearctica 105.5R(r)]AJI84493.1 50S ribosomal protein L25 [Yersinia enterocolitica]AJJ22713.1 50S ribosomal protein L25 [Yersinia enterocolitica]AJJ286
MITIKAEVRNDQGKGASRRLRAANKFPAIIYGGSEAAIAIELDHDTTKNLELKPGFYDNTGLTLVINGKETKVKVQAVQRHAFKPKLTHIDFVRI